MLQFNEQLLGSEHTNIVCEYYDSDTPNRFSKRLTEMSEDWYYRTHPVTYKLNSYGHRCEDLTSIDLNNYILFVGDSNTFGLGLELEKTYAYIMAKTLGMSYYNLGIPASGIDAMFYNLNIWLTKFPKPKYIVLLWTNPERCLIYDNKQYFNSIGPWNEADYKKNMILYGDASNYFIVSYLTTSIMINQLLKFHKIPHSNISVANYRLPIEDNLIKYFIYENMPDRARDMEHLGIKSNQLLANYLIGKYYEYTKYFNI